MASWGQFYAARVERAEVMYPAGHNGDADLSTGDLGPLRAIRLSCGRAIIRRSESDIGQTPERSFTFLFQQRGESMLRHYGTHTALQPGDLCLADNAAPYSLEVSDACELVMLRVPAATLKEYLPSPNHFCGRRLAAEQSLAATASVMAASLVRQIEEGLSEPCRDRAARHLIDMIASCYITAFDQWTAGSSIMAGRYWKVKLFIEEHLRDPDLSPSLVAGHLKLSSRYLRMIFAASNESLSAYILRRRLEECAAQLDDQHWQGHSITEIAFSWGFNSAPHFTRSFRDRFDCSPRDYRVGRKSNKGAIVARADRPAAQLCPVAA